MNINALGVLVQAFGEVMVAFTVIMVHQRVMHEHKIDQSVFAAMRRERSVGMAGIALIVVGAIIQVVW